MESGERRHGIGPTIEALGVAERVLSGRIAMADRNIKNFFVRPHDPVSEVIACIDRSGRVSLALVVDNDSKLINTLSDGDVRRGILAGVRLSDSASALLAIKAQTPYPLPVTAPIGTPEDELLLTMQNLAVRQIPLVDADGVPRNVVILNDLLPQVTRGLRAVIMAGGLGTRLRPLTEDMPKPMLPVVGKPLMEHMICQLRDTGIHHVNITTHYKAEKITEHFGDGADFGVKINYVREEIPLGTGGALGLLNRPEEPLLVINGDVLTQVDFRSMYAFHQDNHADMTVGVRRYEAKVPYGVIECEGVSVRSLREKPELTFFVNAGIYLLEPEVHDYIPANQHMNMTDLVLKLIDCGKSVVSYPICEYWLDIGQHDDYRKAQQDAMSGEVVLPGSTQNGAREL
jgi:dTDP-glucose pyrophosphorylase